MTRIYSETGGHPFLTVKLLVSFMGWLIERGANMVSRAGKSRAFDDFASSNLDSCDRCRELALRALQRNRGRPLRPIGRAGKALAALGLFRIAGHSARSPELPLPGIDDYVRCSRPTALGRRRTSS